MYASQTASFNSLPGNFVELAVYKLTLYMAHNMGNISTGVSI